MMSNGIVLGLTVVSPPGENIGPGPHKSLINNINGAKSVVTLRLSQSRYEVFQMILKAQIDLCMWFLWPRIMGVCKQVHCVNKYMCRRVRMYLTTTVKLLM